MAIKSISFRLEENLLKKFRFAAAYEGRTANSQVRILIRDFVNAYEKEHGKIEIEEKDACDS